MVSTLGIFKNIILASINLNLNTQISKIEWWFQIMKHLLLFISQLVKEILVMILAIHRLNM